MKKLRFLVSLTTRDNDYQLEQAAAAQETSRRLGVDFEILYADNDAITQSTQILKVVQAAPELRPDAIVFEPVGGTSLPQVARTAVGAGISWAVLNREAEYLTDLRKTSRIPIFSISSDHKEVGKIQGQQGDAGYAAREYPSDCSARAMDGGECAQKHFLVAAFESCQQRRHRSDRRAE